MIKVITAALLASAIAVPAQAADFLKYTFNATGTSRSYESGRYPDYRDKFVLNESATGQFIYYLPLGQIAASTGTTVTGPPVSTYTKTPSSSTTTISATATTLSFTDGFGEVLVPSPLNGFQQRVTGQTVNVSVCGAFGGVFPTQSTALDPACSTGSVSFNSRYSGGGDSFVSNFEFNGTINSLEVLEGFGSPPAIGLTSAPAVPEPATWAMMLIGFAVTGFGLRRRSAPLKQSLAPR